MCIYIPQKSRTNPRPESRRWLCRKWCSRCLQTWWSRMRPRYSSRNHQTPKPEKPKPETRNPKSETRNPKPETRNSKPETRNPNSETRNSIPETRNPKPETWSPEPYTRNSKLETLKPTPYSLHPTSFTLNPKLQTLYPFPYTLNPEIQRGVPKEEAEVHTRSGERPGSAWVGLTDLILFHNFDEFVPHTYMVNIQSPHSEKTRVDSGPIEGRCKATWKKGIRTPMKRDRSTRSSQWWSKFGPVGCQ